ALLSDRCAETLLRADPRARWAGDRSAGVNGSPGCGCRPIYAQPVCCATDRQTGVARIRGCVDFSQRADGCRLDAASPALEVVTSSPTCAGCAAILWRHC